MLGNILIGVDKAAAGHRVALYFQHAPILAVAHVAVGLAIANVIQQQLHVLFRVARAVLAVVGVIAEDTIHRCTDANDVVGEAEQL